MALIGAAALALAMGQGVAAEAKDMVIQAGPFIDAASKSGGEPVPG